MQEHPTRQFTICVRCGRERDFGRRRPDGDYDDRWLTLYHDEGIIEPKGVVCFGCQTPDEQRRSIAARRRVLAERRRAERP